MIDTHSIEIVKSTAPVLQKNSEAIGKRFYQLLFESYPELYNIFNQTNQQKSNRSFSTWAILDLKGKNTR